MCRKRPMMYMYTSTREIPDKISGIDHSGTACKAVPLS